MKTLLLFGLFYFMSKELIFAQYTFEKSYSGRYAISVNANKDGSFVMTGGKGNIYFSGTGMFIKVDSIGNTLLDFSFGAGVADRGLSVIEAFDSGYVVAGFSARLLQNNYDALIVKFDKFGDTVWAKNYGDTMNDGFNEIIKTNDSCYLAIGWTGDDIFMQKVDRLGNVIWGKVFGNIESEYGYSLCETSDHGFIIVGTVSLTNFDDVLLIKTDSAGNISWSKSLPDINFEMPNSIRVTSNGSYLIGGYKEMNHTGDYYYFILKTDSAANVLWNKTNLTTLPVNFPRVSMDLEVVENDNCIAVCGVYDTNSISSYNVSLIKFNSNGDTLWTKSIGTTENEVGFSIDVASDGGFVIAASGVDLNSPYNSKAYILKTDSLGNSCNSKHTQVDISDYPVGNVNYTCNLTTGLYASNIIMLKNNVPSVVSNQCLINKVEQNENEFINIHPNPTDGVFYIESAEFTNGTIFICNSEGITVFRKVLNDKSNFSIDLSGYPSGIYLAGFYGNGKYFLRKLIIN